MSDYDHSMHSRNYPPNHLSGGGGGTGLFWALLAVAGLGLLVLIGGFGGGATPVDHPGGAGADGVAVTPVEPVPGASATTAID